MKLKKIKINNYKSITKPISVDHFSRFNILVGPNNAGKTNVLDAFEIFFNTKNKELQRVDGDIELTIEIDGKEKVFEYKGGPPNLIEKHKSLVRIGHSANFKEVAHQELPEFKKEYTKEYQKLSSVLKNNFQTSNIDSNILEFQNQKEQLHRMGDGFKRLFVILFYLYHPRYKMVLIDEPELHLHPSVIKKFLKILDSNKDTQVLMTTHHPTLVQARFLDKIWRVARDSDLSTMIHKFDQNTDIDMDRFVQEINDDNSAMLFADKVLLVEGISDSILMRGVIDKFYKHPEDIKVVYSGGVGDIDLYEKICRIFNIPYRVMIDGDMLNMYWNKKFSKEKKVAKNKKRELLERKNIFVLRGDLEDNYPKKYQKKETKPLNALLASSMITEEDFSKMTEIKRVLENL